MRSARRASAQSAGCEARSAEQTVDTPHQRRCRGSEATSTTLKSVERTLNNVNMKNDILNIKNCLNPKRYCRFASTAFFCYVISFKLNFNLYFINLMFERFLEAYTTLSLKLAATRMPLILS